MWLEGLDGKGVRIEPPGISGGLLALGGAKVPPGRAAVASPKATNIAQGP